MSSAQDNPAVERVARFGPYEADFRAWRLRKFGLAIPIQEVPLRILMSLLEAPGRVVTREELLQRLWPAEPACAHEHHLNAAVSKLRGSLSDLPEHPRFVETVPRSGYRYVGPPVDWEKRRTESFQETAPPPEDAAPDIPAARSETRTCLNGFELDLDSRQLFKDGISLPLRPQAFRVLALLASHKGQLVSREEIRREIWGDATFVDFEQGLNHCIAQVRKALGDDHLDSRFIHTVPGRGYRLLVDASPPAEAPPSDGSRPGARRRRWWVTGIAAVATVSLSLLLAWRTGWWSGNPSSGVFFPTIRSIAVLPLENLSNDPAQEFFADGMTEELVTTLGKVGSLRVISRTSVMRYKRTTKPIPEIAQELDVDAIIEGTVQQVDGRVRVTVNLLHGPSDRHLWAERFEEELGDVLLMQREIARAVARQVRASLSPEAQARLAALRSLNPEAHDLYLKGQYHYYKWRAPEFRKAISYFERAIEVDPGYAQAHLGLAKTYGWLWITGAIPPNEAYPRFTASLRRALEIDDTVPEAHYVKAVAAWYFYWNWAEAEAEFKRALELNPSFEEARFEYAWFLSTMGRMEEAVREAERAVEGDPLSVSANLALGSVYQTSGQADKAVAQLRKAMELEPTDPRVYEFLGGAYGILGLHDQAVAMRQREMLLTGASREDLAEVEAAYRQGGYPGYQRWLLARAQNPYNKAKLQAELGMHDEAFANLEICYKQHWWAMVRLYSGKEWGPLRQDARFQELLRRMNFPTQN
ncbi:MAG: winged helix-turn-helix domain-containing protein [Bryobacterales bacterium]|nr:winged helix-turn-helix domain-containing protein [Bryobacterales bacterium]